MTVRRKKTKEKEKKRKQQERFIYNGYGNFDRFVSSFFLLDKNICKLYKILTKLFEANNLKFE